MTFSALTILIVAFVAAVIAVMGAWAYASANRLDRLHVRSDLSWQALDAALARRAVVVRAIASSVAYASIESKRLTALADQAERANRAQREAAENALSGALTTLDNTSLPPQLVAELADAEARVLIARRFHNDAVRDTLALRTRRPVRWLHLGGTAPLPTYFEIAERTQSQGPELDEVRTSARVVMLDQSGRVLLMRGHDPETPEAAFWFTVGGAVETGETLRAAAVREIREETGRAVPTEALRGPLWRRVAVFPFAGELIRSEELFFAVRTDEFMPHRDGFTEFEQQTITEHRWCTAPEIREIQRKGEPVYPQDLPDLLDEANLAVVRHEEPEVHAIR
ncbi:NUDIX hydrolase [Rhodococcus spongiicola]|uniref:NUDIX domain-containing protein n=1 Tax=Rhodococcus spongiicola TaxID=2487352 RepID=A0A3S3E1V0_9NOCA|nr:NUDIX domain-containing protein [Rhodococcus spongiicola]RVW03468.1 NUDIX domain-containing protein [Rhodococcus spongiicola]